jgi:phosphoglycolate phosphatase
MRFKGVIFDLDGTLLNTIGDLARSMNTVLVRFGYPQHDVEAYKTFVGDGLEMLVRRSMPDSVREDDMLHARCVEAMRKEYHRRRTETTAPYPGIPELLDGLTAGRIRMAVLSNKPDSPTKLLVAELLPHWRFEAIFGESPATPRKPDPTGALLVARSLQIPPHELLFLGDTGVDMQTATKAGMYAVGALWGFRNADELQDGGAQALVETPQDLLFILA